MTRILVVDDCSVDRIMAGELLKQEPGFSVEFAQSGLEALSVIELSPPDLVLTDLQMPLINGLQLVSTMRQRFPGVPVILMTSQGSEEVAYQALQGGAASYVPKSMLPANLRDTVQKVLQAASHEARYFKTMACLIRSDRVFRLGNDVALVAPLIAHLQDECAVMGLCDSSDRTRLGVALGEALTNALFHGNLELSSELRETDSDSYHRLAAERRCLLPYRERHVEIEVHLDREQGIFAIRDEGPGFNLASLPDPDDPANLEKVSGRGILLMRAFMDRVEFNARGNEVTLIKQANVRTRRA